MQPFHIENELRLRKQLLLGGLFALSAYVTCAFLSTVFITKYVHAQDAAAESLWRERISVQQYFSIHSPEAMDLFDAVLIESGQEALAVKLEKKFFPTTYAMPGEFDWGERRTSMMRGVDAGTTDLSDLMFLDQSIAAYKQIKGITE